MHISFLLFFYSLRMAIKKRNRTKQQQQYCARQPRKWSSLPCIFDFPFSMSVVDRNGAVVGMIMFCLLIFPPTAFHREVEPLLTSLFPFFNLTSSYWARVQYESILKTYSPYFELGRGVKQVNILGNFNILTSRSSVIISIFFYRQLISFTCFPSALIAGNFFPLDDGTRYCDILQFPLHLLDIEYGRDPSTEFNSSNKGNYLLRSPHKSSRDYLLIHAAMEC